MTDYFNTNISYRIIIAQIIFLIVPINCFAQSNWDIYTFGKICSLRIPPTMELRDPDSRSGYFINHNRDKTIINYFGKSLSDETIVFQQKGLNSDNQEIIRKSSQHYARVMIDDVKQNELTQNDIYKMTSREILFLDKSWKDECMKQFYIIFPKSAKFIWYPLKRQKIGGKYVLVSYYRREGLGGTMVNVHEYKFFFLNHLLRITISYRESEEHLWKSDFSKIIQTLSFN